MKKPALALVFAFLTAGVFAQVLNFRGAIHTGVVMNFPDGGDPTISVWSPLEGITSRVYLRGSVADAPGRDGTFGFNFEIRVDAPFNTDTNSLYFEEAQGWVKFWDKKLTLVGGKLNYNGVFNTLGGIYEENMARYDLGIHLRLENIPRIPNLTLGATMMPGTTDQLNLTNIFERGHYRFAARYLIPDKAGILVMFYDNAGTDIYPRDRLNAFLAFDILTLRSKRFTVLRADFGAYDMQDKHYFNIKAGQYIVYRNGDLELGGRFRQSFLLGDAKDTTIGYSPEFLFRLWGAYALKNGTIRPRLEAGYLLHGFPGNPVVTSPNMRTDGFETVNSRRTLVDPTRLNDSDKVRGFRQDVGYLAILPQCEFRIDGRNSTAITIGGGPLFDLTAGKEKHNYFIFSNLRVNF